MSKHKYYHLLNLIGYGLAKFDTQLIKQFGFNTKTDFYQYFVQLGLAETTGVVKQRMDLFDPYFENGRRGWWQKKDVYEHRKLFIDSLFGTADVTEFADILKMSLKEEGFLKDIFVAQKPIIQTRFRKLQETGLEAEQYFWQHFQSVPLFKAGSIEDARLYGDGYDFQITTTDRVFLSEVKGIRENRGRFRMTEKEFFKAKEFPNQFVLSLVLNLENIPRIVTIENPLKELGFREKIVQSKAVKEYHVLEDIY
ncbi:DUF3883 domain-containing protein [Streptococcus suis]|uniref:Zn-finger n=1 Tax=Streptococcus suis TaxID=1307 RepID=A0A123SYG5_STRSU|nr:DUF3883 domain-containing protein [Streptococcus suis]NQI13071.1 DUF3883 domain-containing protein [Streptococcus suis]NQN89556.1 DUF3883 domain-containing protein [Streptococcus suis]NQO09826.1 DUF3883 domain-containing protein [Streptococcus suis]NQO11772.1 DUF3883 domain-containing protein [Streptococcus suis]